MKYLTSPPVFNIYAPKKNEWHCAIYECEDGSDFLKLIAIFGMSRDDIPDNRGLVEITKDDVDLLFKYCTNLLPNHEEVPDIKPAA